MQRAVAGKGRNSRRRTWEEGGEKEKALRNFRQSVGPVGLLAAGAVGQRGHMLERSAQPNPSMNPATSSLPDKMVEERPVVAPFAVPLAAQSLTLVQDCAGAADHGQYLATRRVSTCLGCMKASLDIPMHPMDNMLDIQFEGIDIYYQT